MVTHRARQRAPELGRMGSGTKTSGLVGKPRITPLEDTTKARSDHKLGVLMDLPASSMGTTILAIEATVMAAQPTKGTSSLS